ncbi:MAG TPA: amidohydrolase family protein, partial [Candidatus Binataceae bacterium]|nr:amidohydrolase family protein [Candidatus Binataceae bacterium]
MSIATPIQPGNLVIDCDSHVMEPADLWESYLEPEFRSRAIRIARDPADSMEVMYIDNQPLLKGVLGGLGGVSIDRQKLLTPGAVTYAEGCPPASYRSDDRTKLLDAWGVDAGVLFPTVGILWDTPDDALAAAYARAYNNWLNDHASGAPDRMIKIAHLALQNPETALAELRRCLKLGFKGIFLAPEPINGRRFSDPMFDPIWRECEEAGIPACLHVIVRFNRAPGL